MTDAVSPRRTSVPTLSKILSRRRLHERLDRAPEQALVLLYGKAGQGKSTLMADYLETRRIQGSWCVLTDAHTDPDLFLYSLQSSLPGGKPTPPAGGLDTVLAHLELRQKPLWIVLDGFRAVNSSPQVCSLIEDLIANRPRQVGMAVLSRDYPNFSLSGALASRQLISIEDAELAFSREETEQLFQTIYPIDLPAPELTEICEISEGWITALIHLAESLDGKPEELLSRALQHFLSARQLPSLDQYFARVVMNELPEESRELLATLSVFSAFPPDLVSSLTGGSGRRILEDLLAGNIFIRRLDPQGQLFVLHPLFRQFLLHRFSTFPDSRRTSIHSAAADFFRSRGDHEAAAHHIRLSRGFAEAREQLLQEAEILLEQGRYQRLYDLLESFPRDIRNKEPLLLYYHTITTNLIQPFASRKTLVDLLQVFRESRDVHREAKIHSVLLVNYLFYQGNREAVGEILSATENFLSQHAKQLDHALRLTLDTLIEFARWWTTPDIEDAFDIALRAEETAHRIRNEEVLVFAHLILARIYIDRGDFHRSTEVLEETETLIRRHSALRQYEPLLRFYLGDTYFYLGELSMALDQIEQGLQHTFPQFAFSQYLKMNQVLYLLYVPELERAEAVLGTIREKSTGENLYLRYYSIYLLHMLLSYRKNNRERAAYYCRRLMDPENQDLLSTDYPYSYIALAEVQHFLQWYELAEDTLVTLLGKISTAKFPYPAATANGLLGCIYVQRGKKKPGEKHLRICAEIVDQHGYKNLDICNPVLLHNIAARIAPVSTTGVRTFARLAHMSASQIIDESMEGLYVYTLGEFRVVINGKELSVDTVSRHKKVMDVLKLLIVHRRTGLPKEVLFDLFWEGYLEKSSRSNLNTILYRLRKLLGEDDQYIITDSGTVQLNNAVCTVDADDFCRLVQLGDDEKHKGNLSAAINAYLKAKSIYRGDFLAKDLYFDDIRDARDSLRAGYLQLLSELAKTQLETGRYHQALETSKELLAQDRLCEPGYRLLMVCCSLVGNRSDIPRIYKRLEERLLRSFNISPDPQTSALKHSLLHGGSPTPEMWRKETIL